jgi:hypothetical protein
VWHLSEAGFEGYRYGILANHIDPLAHLLISDLSNAVCCPTLLLIVLRHGNCKAIHQTDYCLRFRTQWTKRAKGPNFAARSPLQESMYCFE